MESLLLPVRFELLSLDMVEARESLLAKLQELQSNPPKGGASSWDAFVPETKLRLPPQEPSFAEHGADPFDKQAYMEGDEPQAEEQSLRAEHGLAVPQVRRHSAQRRLPSALPAATDVAVGWGSRWRKSRQWWRIASRGSARGTRSVPTRSTVATRKTSTICQDKDG